MAIPTVTDQLWELLQPLLSATPTPLRGEQRADIHEAFLWLARRLICWRHLESSY